MKKQQIALTGYDLYKWDAGRWVDLGRHHIYTKIEDERTKCVPRYQRLRRKRRTSQ